MPGNRNAYRQRQHEFQLSRGFWRRRAARMPPCSTIACAATPRCSIAATPWKPLGRWSTPSWMSGAPQRPPPSRIPIGKLGARGNPIFARTRRPAMVQPLSLSLKRRRRLLCQPRFSQSAPRLGEMLFSCVSTAFRRAWLQPCRKIAPTRPALAAGDALLIHSDSPAQDVASLLASLLPCALRLSGCLTPAPSWVKVGPCCLLCYRIKSV